MQKAPFTISICYATIHQNAILFAEAEGLSDTAVGMGERTVGDKPAEVGQRSDMKKSRLWASHLTQRSSICAAYMSQYPSMQDSSYVLRIRLPNNFLLHLTIVSQQSPHLDLLLLCTRLPWVLCLKDVIHLFKSESLCLDEEEIHEGELEQIPEHEEDVEPVPDLPHVS